MGVERELSSEAQLMTAVTEYLGEQEDHHFEKWLLLNGYRAADAIDCIALCDLAASDLRDADFAEALLEDDEFDFAEVNLPDIDYR